MSVQSTSLSRNRPIKVITTSEDATLDTIDDQIHVFSPTTPPTVPPATIKVTLPCNPLAGEQHLIVANGANVLLDAGDTPIIGLPPGPAPNTLASGTALSLVFSQEAGQCNDNNNCNCNNQPANAGNWVAVCC